MLHGKLLFPLGSETEAIEYAISRPRWAAAARGYDETNIETWEKVAEIINKGMIDADSDEGAPAGLTYVLQLLAHDVALHSTPSAFSSSANDFLPMNRRPNALMLDTLYGEDCQLSDLQFANPVRRGASSNVHYVYEGRFELGKMDADAGPEANGTDFGRVPEHNDDPAAPVVRHYRARAADRRNDSHFLINQITVLWARYHNAMLEEITALGRPPTTFHGDPSKSSEVSLACFQAARAATIAAWHNVIRNDVIPAYTSATEQEIKAGVDKLKAAGLDSDKGFAFAILRAFHCLPLDSYIFETRDFELKDILSIGGHDSITRPFDAWRMPWAKFFDFPGQPKAVNRAFLRHQIPKDLKMALNGAGSPNRTPVNAVDFARAPLAEAYATEAFDRIFDDELPKHLRSENRKATLAALFKDLASNEDLLETVSAFMPISLLIQLEACCPSADPKERVKSSKLGKVGGLLFSASLLTRLEAAEQSSASYADLTPAQRITEVIETAYP